MVDPSITHDLIEQHIQTIAAVTVAIQVTNAVEYYSLNALIVELSQKIASIEGNSDDALVERKM
jgi:hypothetical protein